MFESEGLVGELRAVVGSLRSESLPELPDARIEEDFAALHQVMEQLEAERLRRLAEVDRRRLFERDGHLSAASWLASRFRVAWGVAREQVRVARALEDMGLVRSALEGEELSMSGVRVLITAHEAAPEAFVRDEAQLLEAARHHTVGDLRRVVAFWRQGVERAAGLDRAEVLRHRRRLHASVTLDGMVRVDGDLDPVNGESVLTALRAVADTEVRSDGGDGRTPPQRRADALGEICRQWLDHGDRPAVAGERPHLTITVRAQALAAAHGSGELDHTGPIDPGTARRLACDASVMRVVMGPRSEPLDVGRRTPVVPPGLRRAVIVRDRHCRFPGCDRPWSWCDVHHARHWADGGPTALGNLLLLCRRHHGAVHRDGGFGLTMAEGRPVVRRPDGSVLAERGPP